MNDAEGTNTEPDVETVSGDPEQPIPNGGDKTMNDAEGTNTEPDVETVSGDPEQPIPNGGGK